MQALLVDILALAGTTAQAIGRGDDALPLIRSIEENWPDVVCLDGKTGSAQAALWRKRPEIERELAFLSAWPTGLVKTEKEGAPTTANVQRPFEIPGHTPREVVRFP